jgi:UDP-glucose-4-epimerase GalE
VVVVDTLEHGRRAAVGATELVVGDVADRQLVRSVLDDRRIEAIIHFAAYKSVEESVERPGAYFDNNVCGTLALAEVVVEAGVRPLVFSSTCAVYGASASQPIAEDAPLEPENPYGESKVLCERMLRWFDVSHRLRYASLRYFNAAGAWPDGSIGEDLTGARALIPLTIRAALMPGETLRIFGTDYPTPDGTAIRDYVHVVDLVDAHIQVLDWMLREDRSLTVNLGTGRGTSVREVVAAVERVSGCRVPVEAAPRRPGDAPAIWADPSHAAAVLGWTARHGLDEIVESAWRWHSTHPDGYGSSEAIAIP